MSTDDLIRRARDLAALFGDAEPRRRALLSELADEVEGLRTLALFGARKWGEAEEERQAAVAQRDWLRAQLESGEASDGFHTHAELYEYRMLYNAHTAQGWLAAGIPVVKSWKHSDGKLCFGGGWFIVVATLPTGQVSNHYKAEHWDLFHVPDVDLPPEYDGHEPDDASNRLRAALEGAPAMPGRDLDGTPGSVA